LSLQGAKRGEKRERFVCAVEELTAAATVNEVPMNAGMRRAIEGAFDQVTDLIVDMQFHQSRPRVAKGSRALTRGRRRQLRSCREHARLRSIDAQGGSRRI
jgi:hypothetical protein